MKKNRVVITGLGVVAPNGIGKDEFWSACLDGKSGIDLIQIFDASLFNSRICGRINNFDPELFISKEFSRRTDRFVHLGLTACKLCLQDSKLDLDQEDLKRIGVIIGSGLGGQIFHEEQIAAAYAKGPDKISPRSVSKICPNAVSSNIAMYFGCKGPNMVISTACSSSTMAIGEALRYMQNSDMEICVSGGAEAPLTRFNFGAYDAMGALSRRNDSPKEAIRPFDKERDGFVLSEGASILILEKLEHALNRGAHIYAELTGYSCNCDSYDMVKPLLSGIDASRVMSDALIDAGTKPASVDYINAHGTATFFNDKVETLAIKNAFGEYAYKIPVSSIKSMIGHSLGAAGAIEAAAVCLTIENEVIPPTINYKHPDPECDLDYVPNYARKAKIKTAVSNSFGFGGINSCLVFRKYEG
jgi:3-oxoacyl-[acyl-carrier-protein] synthase II